MMLTNFEKNFISSFFNDGGYVLNFSNATFDDFTAESVGIPIKSKYSLSKAKSLNAFIMEESDERILKLVKNLIDHIEFGNARLSDSKEKLYPKLKELAENHSTSMNFSSQLVENVKMKFDDKYIENQLQLMLSLIVESPSDVIGKSKELLESCFKHILDEFGELYTPNDTISSLRKKAFAKLNLDVKANISAKNNEDVKKILSSFNTIVDGLSSLRNDKGDGHGKGKDFKELPKRYAQLAMRASLTIVHFAWDTYKEVYQ